MTLEEAIAEVSVDIIGALRKHGIKGLKCSPKLCPIAELLSKMVGQRVRVGKFYATGDETTTLPHLVELPSSIVKFILEFDCGDHNEFFGIYRASTT